MPSRSQGHSHHSRPYSDNSGVWEEIGESNDASDITSPANLQSSQPRTSIMSLPPSANIPPVEATIGAPQPSIRAPLGRESTMPGASLPGAGSVYGTEGTNIASHGVQIATPEQPEGLYITEQLASALYDFTAEKPSDLTVREGETLVFIREENKDWWTLRNICGEEGIVPSTYIELRGILLRSEDDNDNANAPISVPDTTSLLSTVVMPQVSSRPLSELHVSPGFLGLETGYNTPSFSKVDKKTVSVQSQSIEEGLKDLRGQNLLAGREEDAIRPILEVGRDLNKEVSELEDQTRNATDLNSEFFDRARKLLNDLRELLEFIHLPNIRNDPSHQQLLNMLLSALASLARLLFSLPETANEYSKDCFRLSKYGLLIATSYLPKEHQVKPIVASHWGTLYFRRFEIFRASYHITQAIKFHQQSIAAASRGSEKYPKLAMLWGWLGRSYLARFEDSQSAGDLKNGIELSSKAWREIQSNIGGATVEERNVILEGTSCGIQCLIEHVGGSNSLDLVNSGIKEWQATLKNHFTDKHHLTDKHHFTDNQTDRILKAGCMRILGFLYNIRSDQLGSHDRVKDDLEKSRIFLSAAVALLPEHHQHFLSTLCLFARSLTASAGVKVQSHPELALEFLRLAECFTQSVPHFKPYLYVSFGDFYMSRQGVNSAPSGSDLEGAVEYYENSLKDHCRPGSRLWAKARQKLGLCRLHEYKALKKLKKEDEAEEAFKMALRQFIHIALFPEGHLFDRFTAACSWATSAASHSVFQTQALYAYETALELIPLIACFGVVPDQRHKATQKCGQLAAEAAATAINMGKNISAITLLERGRSVKWNHMLQLQSPLHILRLSPGGEPLANQLEEILKNLQLGGSTSSESGEQSSHGNVDLQEQYQNVLVKIRNLKGLGNFMRPKTFNDLVKAARNGPVVVINIHHSRCDALIVEVGDGESAGSVRSVRLDNLRPNRIIEMRKSINLSLKKIGNARVKPTAEQEKGIKELKAELKNLWYWVVKPIFGELKYEPRSTCDADPNSLHRITWCPTGPLSFFPLHAAGDYDHPNKSLRTHEYVVSSYAPTLSALVPDSGQDDDKDCEILLVNPGASAKGKILPMAKAELDCIVHHFTVATSTGSLGQRLAEKKYLGLSLTNSSNSLNSSQAQSDPEFCLDMNGVSDDELDQDLKIRIPRTTTGTGVPQAHSTTPRYTRLEGPKASPKKVYEEMQNHDCVHFACHTKHSDDPAKYGFELAGGLLSLKAIAQMPYEKRGLAFLSACGTAEGNQNLPDEAVHLASGMLTAGYSSVIATLWPVKDSDAAFVADLVYRRLMTNKKMKCSRSAVALHAAIDILRKDPRVRLPDWISFVHFG